MRVKISFTLPTRAQSARTFLFISALSISTCKTALCGAKVAGLEITRSEKRMPSAMIRSERLIAAFEALVPCMPTIPVHSGCLDGNDVMPMRVWHTGIAAFSAKTRSSSHAQALKMPPPAQITGRCASFIMRAAFSTASPLTGSGCSARLSAPNLWMHTFMPADVFLSMGS